MKIELHEIAIRDIVDGYIDNAENGGVGYKGLLNIRPAYQREFVYDEEKKSRCNKFDKPQIPLKCNVLDKERKWEF